MKVEDGRNVVCNPLDVGYRYQEIRTAEGGRTVHREGADPSVVFFRDHYFLFASMSHGFWHSADLTTWHYRPTDKLPALDYAPDVREVNGSLYICASRREVPGPFFRSDDPLADDFAEVTPGAFEFWDPSLFQDLDGRSYFYWGCSDSAPLRGTEVDPERFEPIGDPVEVLSGDPERRGWEQLQERDPRPGRITQANPELSAPWIEGSWMTRHGEVYYLQYAAPATEYNVYADGYASSGSPLGPFDYSLDSPFSSKPGGFITGAGHGSTFQDRYGNWWHAATMRVSVNHPFERRIGIFPAGFDDDGVLFCNQNFADYPMRVHQRRFDPWSEASAGWMLLSFRATASASNALPGHGPELAVDEDARTWWVAESLESGQWIQLDLGEDVEVRALQVNFADHDVASFAPARTDLVDFYGSHRAIDPDDHAVTFELELSPNGEDWSPITQPSAEGRDAPHAFIELGEATRARHVRLTITAMPYAARAAVSGLRVFGRSDRPTPSAATPRGVRTSPTSARIDWDAIPGALGYNVRYGRSANKLYHSWLVYEQAGLTLELLNAGADYWVAVDAFNGAGATPGGSVPIV